MQNIPHPGQQLCLTRRCRCDLHNIKKGILVEGLLTPFPADKLLQPIDFPSIQSTAEQNGSKIKQNKKNDGY